MTISNKMKVLVTGASGFLGANVVRQLLAQGHSVIATHRVNSLLWRLTDVKDNIQLCEIDLQDKESILEAFSKSHPDAVINCAAYGVKYDEQDLHKAFAVNVLGVANLISASEYFNISRFIHIGSCFEYGDKDHSIHENETAEPTSIYGASKISGTLLALILSKEKKVPLTVVRPFGLWGPLEGEYRLVPQIITNCQSGRPLKLTGCKQVRDYTYIEDASLMLIKLLEIEDFPAYEIFNMGSGTPIILKEFVTIIASFFDQEDILLFDDLPYRSTEMWHLVANVEKWNNSIAPIMKTSVSTGIQKMLEQDS